MVYHNARRVVGWKVGTFERLNVPTFEYFVSPSPPHSANVNIARSTLAIHGTLQAHPSAPLPQPHPSESEKILGFLAPKQES